MVISPSSVRTSIISAKPANLVPQTAPLDTIRRAVMSFGPHAGAHRVALRAATSIAVPLLVLYTLGRMDLSMYASFGSLAALYGRFDDYGNRLRMQLGAGAVFLSVMLIGAFLAAVGAQTTVRIMTVALVATLVTALATGFSWHPGGATFAVFAAGAVATTHATWFTVLQVLLVGGAAVLWSLSLTAVLGLWRTKSLRRVFVPTTSANFQGEWSVPVTVGVGALLAGLIGQTFDDDHWYWAMVAASVVLAGTATTSRLARSLQRFAGTTLGVLVGAALLWLELPTIGLIFIVIGLQGAAELLIGRNYGIAMLVVTPLALLMVSLAYPTDPTVLVLDRVFETFIGSLVGTIIALVSAEMRTERSHSAEAGLEP